MLLGLDVWKVLEHLPARACGTRHGKLIGFLRSRGVDIAPRFTRARTPPWPLNAIARVTWPDGKGHVVLKIGRFWLDPDQPRVFCGEMSSDRSYGNGRVTSFCEVYAL